MRAMRTLATHRHLLLLGLGAALVACGDAGSTSASATDSGTQGAPTSGVPGSTTTVPTTSATDGSGTASASASTGDPTPTEPVDDSTSSTGGGLKLDVGTQADFAVDCDCGMASEFSYIWVANSPEGTVSKIDTTTVQEVARYRTRGDAMGNPSRTSVSISGRAVAIANRHGGLVKIWSNQSDCDPNKNGMPGLQTSSGAGDVLAWDQDDCVAWYTDFPDWTTQRPVAWAPGQFNDGTCSWSNEQVWTAGCANGFQPGFGDGFSRVALVDGDTGAVIEKFELNGYPCNGFGPYGGAVDSTGNLWLTLNNGALAFIDRQTLTHTVHDKPADVQSYGMTVDDKGRPWVTSYSATTGVARYDPLTKTWTSTGAVVGYGQSGITQGKDGRMWIAGFFNGSGGVAGFDPETLALVETIPSTCNGKGVSVDGKGFLWCAGGSVAARIDLAAKTETAYNGLNGAYTYSDMTGFGVANAVGCQPAG
jgi:hypothetical protein